MAVYEGELVGTGLKFGIVVSRWNDLITRRLLEGAEDGLRRHGVVAENIDIAWVPGSFELPVVCKRMAETGRYDGIIALGAVMTTSPGWRRAGSPRLEFRQGFHAFLEL